MSIVVSSLPAYVEEHNSDLIAKMLFGARTSKYLTPMLGVKGKSALHLLETSVTLGNGRACAWNEAGSSTLTNRTLETYPYKVNMAFCDKTLIGTYAEYGVRIAAGQKSLPFEEDFINDVIEKLGYSLDAKIWNGSGITESTSEMTGLLTLAAADDSVLDLTITAGSTYIAAVQAAVAKMPIDIINGDAVIFCSPEFLRAYKFALVNANLYHVEANDDAEEIKVAGSVVRLIAVPGLTGIKKLFGCNLREVFYGTDGMGDEAKFEFWYSQDNREFRLAIEFTAGVQYAFGDHIVLATYTTLA